MQKTWKVKPANPQLQKELSLALNISPILARLLINRGAADIQQAQDFLDCDLANLPDPFLLKGMRQAVRRIREAIAKNEKIMVWGDYDIDGITSTALLVLVLKKMGAEVLHYLPNRLEEGYGLNKNGASIAHKKAVKLLITVDCGICAHQEVNYLKKLGIDTIICDHHQPKQGLLPSAYAIINPLQKDCPYPYKYLAGVGLAAKLAIALTGNQRDILNEHLDLIALGTIGDIVPLNGENRVLAKHGLAALSQTKKAGLLALMQASGLTNQEVTARHIGYILGPRINASGRLGSPDDSLHLLLTQDKEQAEDLAQKLCQGNRLRQRMENQTLQEAIEQVEREINFKEHHIIVLGAPHWHQGVIGIVASRLVERYFRPAIILKLKDGFGLGSGRSIGNFHLLEAVARCKDLLEEYGGHKGACGIRLKKEKLSEFFQSINQVASEMLMPEDLIPSIEIDLEMPLADLTVDLIKALERLAPFGAGNPQPLFCSSGLLVKSKSFTIAGSHIKFWVSDERLTCEAIGYNKAGAFPQFLGGENIALVYSPSTNNWQGNFSIQLKLEDVRVA